MNAAGAARLVECLVRNPTGLRELAGQFADPLDWLAWLRRPSPTAELGRLAAELAGRPTDRSLLWRLARWLEAEGHADLAAVVLCQLHRLHPAEPQTPAVLARLFLARARQREQPLAIRLKEYDRAFRYLAKALAAADRPDLAAERTRAMVEVTMLKGNYQPVLT